MDKEQLAKIVAEKIDAALKSSEHPKKFYITAADERMVFGKMRDQDVSRFIDEIPESCLERLSSRRSYAPARNFSTGYKPPTAYRPAQMKLPPKILTPPVNWQIGDHVNHTKWGSGTVMEIGGGRLTISFVNPEFGTKIVSDKNASITKT